MTTVREPISWQQRESELDRPLRPGELAERETLPPRELPHPSRITLFSFCCDGAARPELVTDDQQRGGYRVEVETRYDGVKVGALHQRIPSTPLGRDAFEQFCHVNRLDGYRPAHSAVRFLPERSRVDHVIDPGRGEDRPVNVFAPDGRYVYRDSTFPWRTVGRIWTAGGSCSGTVIGPRLVLTASHCVDWLAGGGAGWIKFSPGFHNGNGPWGEYDATRVIYWNQAEGGLTDLETAFDYVVLVMDRRIGDQVGYAGYRTYDDRWNGDRVWQHLGYPGDLTGTQRGAFQGGASISTVGTQGLNGQTGFVLGHFNDSTPGHSGGPVWGWWGEEPWPRVVGVNSAEAATPAFDTSGDNEFGGGPGLSALIAWARSNYP